MFALLLTHRPDSPFLRSEGAASRRVIRPVLGRHPFVAMKKGRVAEMKSAARPFMRRPKEYVADRLWKNKRLGKEKGMAKQTLG